MFGDLMNNRKSLKEVYRETLGYASPELLMVPLAIDAGIGEFSRNGRCLSPEFGTNMRLKAVTTDLPLIADKPISFLLKISLPVIFADISPKKNTFL